MTVYCRSKRAGWWKSTWTVDKVAGIPDARWGQAVAAVVQPRTGAEPPTLAALQAHCRTRLAGYKVPRTLVLTDTIHRSPSGKADYRWARSVAVRGAGLPEG